MNSNENKTLRIAFLISIIFHFILIIPWHLSYIKEQKDSISKDRKKTKLSVIYKSIKLKQTKHKKGELAQSGKNSSFPKEITFKEQQEKSVKADKKEKKQEKNKTKHKQIVKVDKKDISKPSDLKQKEIEKQKKINQKKEKPDTKTETGIVGLEQVPEEQKIAFIEYYKFIRNKIEAVAQEDEIGYFKEGKVNINFRLSSNGKLLEIKVDTSGSSKDKILRSFAIRNIKTASPFPPFPEGLTAEELEFRITIEFHI